MGSYATLLVGSYAVWHAKGDLPVEFFTIFTEQDKYFRVFNRARDLPRPAPIQDAEILLRDSELLFEIGYAAPARVVRERLEVMGFTLAAAHAAYRESANARAVTLYAVTGASARRLPSRSMSSLSVWQRAFNDLRHRKVRSCDIGIKRTSLLQRLMLTEDEYSFFGFEQQQLRHFLRAAIETCNPGDEIALDLTDQVYAGRYEIAEQMTNIARAQLRADVPPNAPLIVLTEGRSDARVLADSLRLLYPHLLDYLSFMDFEAAAAPGGATALVGAVKAFVGAGIANRVVAIFDNDTAARVALRSFKTVDLPANVRCLTLPELPLLRDYPTLGPSGLASMNVNGCAGCIEMYFGKDVLVREDGTYTPIQWYGYDNALRMYQGEPQDKDHLHRKFSEKLAQASVDATIIATQDWSGMRAILERLFAAFGASVGA